MSKEPSRRDITRSVALIWAMLLTSVPVAAQDDLRVFAGGLFGVSTLSADAHSVTNGSDAAMSLYKPENGLALNLFAGVHVAQYFSVQANWMWNRNDLALVSSTITPQGGAFYEQRRRSRQHAIVFDGLIYFRRRDSAVRPYLGTGVSILHFSSDEITSSVAHGFAPPSAATASLASACALTSASISGCRATSAFGTASARPSAAIRSARR